MASPSIHANVMRQGPLTHKLYRWGVPRKGCNRNPGTLRAFNDLAASSWSSRSRQRRCKSRRIFALRPARKSSFKPLCRKLLIIERCSAACDRRKEINHCFYDIYSKLGGVVDPGRGLRHAVVVARGDGRRVGNEAAVVACGGHDRAAPYIDAGVG